MISVDIAIGSDHFGYTLKEAVKQFLLELGHNVVDYGCKDCEEVDYPDVAFRVATDIRDQKYSRGILICGTGIGVCIAANKSLGCAPLFATTLILQNGHARATTPEILAMGAKIIGEEVAKKVSKSGSDSSFRAVVPCVKLKK